MDEATEIEAGGRRWPPVRPRSRFGSFAAGFLLASALATFISMAWALDPSPVTNVFLGNKTIIGQTIAYPAGTPMVNAIILSVPPGAEGAWHTHEAPLFGYILEGELTIDYGSKGVRVYRTGEAVLEAMDWPHRPSNQGTVVARVLAVNIGAEGIPFGDPATGPK